MTVTRFSAPFLNRRTLLLAGGAALAGCSGPNRIGRAYRGPLADQLVLRKSERSLYVLSQGKLLGKHRINLGFAPRGHKLREGDGRTPEGLYHIDRRNNRSAFLLSLGISYPNARDRARAAAQGVSPGGDIFIHGVGREGARKAHKPDWTAGCIAVTDTEIRKLYQMVPLGTPIWIQA